MIIFQCLTYLHPCWHGIVFWVQISAIRWVVSSHQDRGCTVVGFGKVDVLQETNNENNICWLESHYCSKGNHIKLTYIFSFLLNLSPVSTMVDELPYKKRSWTSSMAHNHSWKRQSHVLETMVDEGLQMQANPAMLTTET